MVHTMDSPPFDLHAYEPPISLWSLIEQYSPEHEREEIKNMLGESMIDQSLELHQEIDTLLEIWRDYRNETTNTAPIVSLPEPPGLRDRLVQEIQFFVDNVKEKAKNQGVNPTKILSRHNKDVLEYALDTYRPDSACSSSRPMTARGTEGRETPMMISPTCSDRISAASTLSEEVESMNEKLTVLKFDEVVTHLRSTLEEEIETLMKDINFLQNCLDDEATFRAESRGTLVREPTITELREERSTLEKEMLSNMRPQISPTLKPAFNTPGVIKTLGPNIPPSGKMKIAAINTADFAPVSHKSGPMKAFTSPECHTSGATSHSGPSGPTRLKKDMSDTVDIRHGSSMLTDDTRTTARNPAIKVRSADSAKSAVASKTGSRQLRADLVSKGHGDRGLASDDYRKVSQTRSSHLGAIVTLSKGNTGDASSEVHIVPSPPSSAKPTTPRPSSAQRFRKMVQECRD